jgi:hypothetical protein
VFAQGKPVTGQTVRIVDPSTRVECPSKRVGEIWVSGPGVALGYWDQPEETERTFHARIAESEEGPFLRTGDLGFLLDGYLYVIGRVKDVIIIRGRNLSPGDIETHMRSVHPDLAGLACVACSIKVDDEERLLLVQEMPAGTAERYREIDLAVRTSVAREFGVQPYDFVLVPAGSLPRTESGKAQRAEIRRRYEDGELLALYQASVNETTTSQSVDDAAVSAVEAIILDIWRRVLGRQTITVHDSFGAAGGDSVSAMRVLAGIRQAGFNLAVNDFWRAETVAALARIVRRYDTDPAGQSDGCPELTLAQRQMFALPHPRRLRDNIVDSTSVPAEVLDVDILRAAIDSVVAAHEGLRTTFENDAGIVRPVLRDRFETPILRIVDLPKDVAQEGPVLLAREISGARARISFEHGPLMQCVFVCGDDATSSRFVIVAHHLVTDGLSMQILLEDIEAAYRALAAGGTPHFVRTTSLGEYARHVEEYIGSPQYDADLAFWEDDAEVVKITAVVPPSWPFPPPGQPVRIGGAKRMLVRVPGVRRIGSRLLRRWRRPADVDRFTLAHMLEPDISTSLLEAAAELSIPPPALAVYALTHAVYHLTGGTDQRHGIVGHGRAPVRPETDLSRTVCMFAAIYPLTFHIDPGASAVDALRSVQRRLESVPTGGLAAALALAGSRSIPLTESDDGTPRLIINFQGSFSASKENLFTITSSRLPSEDVSVASTRVPMIWVHCNVRDGCIRFSFRHNVELYSVSMVDQLIATVMDELRDLEAELLRDRVAPVDVHGRA